ncbi:hypothetical protein LAC03_03810 [Levilactobacillus acidifarinae]|nr:hypothetical protein LAC03_03810 [Levilactobacillus acidifarinae]
MPAAFSAEQNGWPLGLLGTDGGPWTAVTVLHVLCDLLTEQNAGAVALPFAERLTAWEPTSAEP